MLDRVVVVASEMPTINLELRFKHLERTNRMMMVTLLALSTFVLGLATMAASSAAPRIVEASTFLLKDTKGQIRADLSSNGEATVLRLYNVNGTEAVHLHAGKNGNAIILSDGEGKLRQASLVNDQENSYTIVRAGQDVYKVVDSERGTALTFFDLARNDLVNVGIGKNETTGLNSGGISINDANGITRASMGKEGFATFDAKAKIDWTSFGNDLTPEEKKKVMDLINSVTPSQHP